MSSTRISIFSALLAAVALAASSATAAPSAAKNLTITATGILQSGSGGGASGPFELQGASAADTDVGKLTFSEGAIPPLARKTPEGLTYVPLNFPATVTGKHGTLVIRMSARQFDVVKVDDSIVTGTWSVVRGTGAYAGLKGGGTLVGLQQAAGSSSISTYRYSLRFQGRVSKG
jgi:hypothetical protein